MVSEVVVAITPVANRKYSNLAQNCDRFTFFAPDRRQTVVCCGTHRHGCWQQ